MTAPVVEATDRAINLVLLVVLVVTAGTLILAVVSLPVLIGTAGGVDAQNRSDQITACRAEYAALVSDAEGSLAEAESLRGDLTIVALRAVVTDDQAGLDDAITESGEILTMIDERRAERGAVAQHRTEAVALSRSDPDAFVARCAADFD